MRQAGLNRHDGSYGDTELRTFVQVIRRTLPTAVFVAAIAATLVYFGSGRLAPNFEATATINLPWPDNEPSLVGTVTFQAPPVDRQAYVVAATSRTVLADALRRLGTDSTNDEIIEELTERMDVSSMRGDDSSLITVTVGGASADDAAMTANAVAWALLEWDRHRAETALEAVIATMSANLSTSRDANVDVADSVPSELESRLQSLLALRGSAISTAQLVTPAEPPLEAASPRPLIYGAVTFLVIVLAAIALSLLRPAVLGKYRVSLEAVDSLSIPYLGQFRATRGPSRRTKAVRGLASYVATYLVSAADDRNGGKVYAITGGRSSEPTRDMALGVAAAFANLGRKTLFIDTDLRNPIRFLASSGQAASGASLGEALRTDKVPRPSTLRQGGASLHVVPASRESDDSTALLANGMRRTLRSLIPKYEVIVLNTTPLLESADSLSFLSVCDSTIIVLDADAMTKADTQITIDLIEQSGGRVGGFLYTSRSVPRVSSRIPKEPRTGRRRAGLTTQGIVLEKDDEYAA